MNCILEVPFLPFDFDLQDGGSGCLSHQSHIRCQDPERTGSNVGSVPRSGCGQPPPHSLQQHGRCVCLLRHARSHMAPPLNRYEARSAVKMSKLDRICALLFHTTSDGNQSHVADMCVTGVNSWKWSKKQTGTSVSWQSQTTVCVRSCLKMSQTEERKHITVVLLSTLSAASLFYVQAAFPLQHTTIIYTIHRKITVTKYFFFFFIYDFFFCQILKTI